MAFKLLALFHLRHIDHIKTMYDVGSNLANFDFSFIMDHDGNSWNLIYELVLYQPILLLCKLSAFERENLVFVAESINSSLCNNLLDLVLRN